MVIGDEGALKFYGAATESERQHAEIILDFTNDGLHVLMVQIALKLHWALQPMFDWPDGRKSNLNDGMIPPDECVALDADWDPAAIDHHVQSRCNTELEEIRDNTLFRPEYRYFAVLEIQRRRKLQQEDNNVVLSRSAEIKALEKQNQEESTDVAKSRFDADFKIHIGNHSLRVEDEKGTIIFSALYDSYPRGKGAAIKMAKTVKGWAIRKTECVAKEQVNGEKNTTTRTYMVEIPLTIKTFYDGPYWISKCTELDILTSNPKKDHVVSGIDVLVDAQVAFAVEHGLLGNLFRADGEVGVAMMDKDPDGAH